MTSHVDYDNIETFNKVLDAVKHLGYSDTSYGNDTCPSISRDFDNGNWQQVWIDYADPEMREDPEWPMFNVVMFDENHDELATDSFDDVEELIVRLKG
jgi:hypothetical protein